MPAEDNKAVVRRILDEFWNAGNIALADELYAPGFVNHDPNAPDFKDREGIKQVNTAYHSAFPDFHVELEQLIGEGDFVVKQWTTQGTQQGELMGIPPTGKRISLTGMTIYRVADGQVQECWWSYDMLGLLRQLGVIPTPEAVST
jgi:steroid delta-isomerase-like uncharacterized protein